MADLFSISLQEILLCDHQGIFAQADLLQIGIQVFQITDLGEFTGAVKPRFCPLSK
ncbi:MAG: hypothetical protein R2824_31620 [Saprospiraceae bacterium]